jgi:hypothetical protein
VASQDCSERFFLPADPTKVVSHEEWKRWYNTGMNPVIVNDVVANHLVSTTFTGHHDPETGELILYMTEVFNFDLPICDPNHRQFISNVDTLEQALRIHKVVVINLAIKHALLPKDGPA